MGQVEINHIFFLVMGAFTYLLLRLVPLIRRRTVKTFQVQIWITENLIPTIISLIVALIILVLGSYDEGIIHFFGWEELNRATAFIMGFMSELLITKADHLRPGGFDREKRRAEFLLNGTSNSRDAG